MMDGRNARQSASFGVSNGESGVSARRVLAIALDMAALDMLPRHILDPGSYIARAEYDALDTVAFTGPSAPDIVLSPLLTPLFDTLDLARYLTQRGYRGRYLALVDQLPNANLIRREVESQSPELNFDIIILDGSTPLHSL